MSQSFVCLFNGVWVGIPHTGLTLRFMGLSGNCLVMVLSLTVLCTLFEFGMSLSNEWQFYTKFVIFIKGTNKSLPSSEILFTALMTGQCRGFKVFYNRRYFLNFMRYLKNQAEGRKGSRGRKLLKSSILWTKKYTSETAKQ